jgi:hypothetical protein
MLIDSILLKLFQQATQVGGLLKRMFLPLHGIVRGNINDIELTSLSAPLKIINKNKALQI